MKKVLSVILTLAMLLGFGAIVAFACDTAECEVAACDCVCATCAVVDCACVCHAEEEAPPAVATEDPEVKALSGYELWKIKLTTGELGAFLQTVGKTLLTWGDWILKFLYYVCFGWLFTIDINITLG
ncbi:MAG: hypothetical protein FWC27_10375 [Firmicutes bacterium]|nr:hypothetical protein [Bacillota bacterium]